MNDTVIVGGIILIALMAGLIWHFTPTYQCPRCHSYNVDDSGEEWVSCKACDFEWRAE